MTRDEYLKAIRLCTYGHHKVRQNKYNDDGVLYLNGLDVNYIEAPTQSLAQRWLRDKHGFFVLIELNSIGLYPHIYNGKLDYKGDYYLSYESALEEGLLMALRYL